MPAFLTSSDHSSTVYFFNLILSRVLYKQNHVGSSLLSGLLLSGCSGGIIPIAVSIGTLSPCAAEWRLNTQPSTGLHQRLQLALVVLLSGILCCATFEGLLAYSNWVVLNVSSCVNATFFSLGQTIGGALLSCRGPHV